MDMMPVSNPYNAEYAHEKINPHMLHEVKIRVQRARLWSTPEGVMKVATFTSSVPRFRFATDGIFDRCRVSGVSN
jgi:hypothetical protein